MDNLIYGLRPIAEAINAGRTIDKLFMFNDLRTPGLKDLLELARANQVTVLRVPREKLDKLCRHPHQGAVAFTSSIEFADVYEVVQQTFEAGQVPLLILLDKVSDVRNFGSIVRSAHAAGAQAVVVPHKGSAALNEEAMKASAGAMNSMAICKVSSLGDTIRMLAKSGVITTACTEKAEQLIYNVNLSEPVALLFGSEGEGIEPHLLRMSARQAAIPMPAGVGSLNVSVAAGIALFEAVRQRLG